MGQGWVPKSPTAYLRQTHRHLQDLSVLGGTRKHGNGQVPEVWMREGEALASARAVPDRTVAKRTMRRRKKFLAKERVPLPPVEQAVKILAERNISSTELDLDVDQETYAVLAQAGWETIQKDKDALVSYAITKALEDLVRSQKEKDARHIA